MQTLAAYQIEIKPHRGQSPRECVEEICTHFSDFILRHYRRRKLTLLPLSFDGRGQIPQLGSRVVASRYIGAHHTLATVDWEIEAPEDARFAWRISMTCACDRQSVELQYRVHVGPTTMLIVPGKSQFKSPPGIVMPIDLLHPLLARWAGTVEGWPIPIAIQLLAAPDVSAFVDKVLLNPKRTLPAIVLAADGRFNATPKGLQEIQRAMIGAAQVAALTNSAATEQLAAILGPERACSTGVLRIYNPRFTRESPPEQHRLSNGKEFSGKGVLESKLHLEVMRRSIDRMPDPPVAQAARAAVCMELSRQTEQIAELTARLAAAEARQLRAEDQRMEMKKERDEARQNIRSAAGKAADQAATIARQSGELLALNEKLAAATDAFAKRRAEHEVATQLLYEREQAAADAQRHLDVLRESMQNRSAHREADAGELAAELQQAWQENDQVLAELEIARHELAMLRGELELCKANLDLLAANPSGKRAAPDKPASADIAAQPPPATVLDALRIAAERFADVLDVWTDAWASAQKSQFPGPTRVLQSLQAIAEVGRAYFIALQGGEALGPLEQAFHAKIPFKYAPCESEMTMAMHGKERVFHGREKRRQIQRHLTLGGGGNCMQIYFEFDDMQQKVIIAHCGRHLSNYR